MRAANVTHTRRCGKDGDGVRGREMGKVYNLLHIMRIWFSWFYIYYYDGNYNENADTLHSAHIHRVHYVGILICKPKIDPTSCPLEMIFLVPHHVQKTQMDIYCLSTVSQWTHRRDPISIHIVAEKILNWYDCDHIRWACVRRLHKRTKPNIHRR